MNPRVLALDLEGTLISNAISQFPRPGLFYFLSQVKMLFPRIVMFTTVREEVFRQVAQGLVETGHAPEWFPFIEYIPWEGEQKDLRFISGVGAEEIWLVDDFEGYVREDQKHRWVPIENFASPYPGDDTGLATVLEIFKWNSTAPNEFRETGLHKPLKESEGSG